MADLRMLILPLFFMAMALPSSSDVLLENPDFETPPTNMTAANTSSANPFLLTAGVNTLPGWSYSGKVWYVSSSPNYSLPGDGHGVRLGENGKINQTFKADAQNVYYYVLSFTIGAESEECFNNLTALNVSVPGKSRVFFLGSSFSSRRDLWETHGYYLGQWGGRYDSINLEIGSVNSSAQPNVSCWPVVDTLVIKTLGPPIWYTGNYFIQLFVGCSVDFEKINLDACVSDGATYNCPSQFC